MQQRTATPPAHTPSPQNQPRQHSHVPPTLLPHTLHNVHAPGLAPRRLQLLPHLQQRHRRQAVEVGRLQLPPRPQGSPSPAPAQHTSHSPGRHVGRGQYTRTSQHTVDTRRHVVPAWYHSPAVAAARQWSPGLAMSGLSLLPVRTHTVPPRRGLVVTRALNQRHTNLQAGRGQAHGNQVHGEHMITMPHGDHTAHSQCTKRRGVRTQCTQAAVLGPAWYHPPAVAAARRWCPGLAVSGLPLLPVRTHTVPP